MDSTTPLVAMPAAFGGQPTVTPGEKVTVRNDDPAPHTLTAVDGSFTTATIAPGASVTLKVPKKVGVYPITCTIHLHMSGVLTVIV